MEKHSGAKKLLKNKYLLLGIFFGVMGLVWTLVAPTFSMKLDPNYTLSLRQSGETRLYVPADDEWIVSSENLEVYDRVKEVGADHYIIDSDFRAYNREGTLDFNASSEYAIDPSTRENLSGIIEVDRHGIFMLPHYPKKQDYLMHSPEVLEEASQLKFSEVTSYRGVDLYKYEYAIENVDKTEFFLLAELAEEERIIGDHTGFILVEPVSGYIVYFSHGGENNVVNAETGEIVRPYEDWFNVTNDDSANLNLHAALTERSDLSAFRYSPLVLFLLLGLLFCCLGYYKNTASVQRYFAKKDRWLMSVGAGVSLVALLVISGWVFDIAMFKSIMPGFVTMKFTTALCFFFSGILAFFMSSGDERNDMEELLVIMSSCVLMLLMGLLLIVAIADANIAIENILFPEADGDPLTVAPGRPSYGTMVAFILISLIGFFDVLVKKGFTMVRIVLASIILFISFLALIGYIFAQPILFFAIEDLSTAMAIHTALLFAVLGVSFLRVFLSRLNAKNK